MTGKPEVSSADEDQLVEIIENSSPCESVPKLPPPPLLHILRTTLEIGEYYVGPNAAHGSIHAMQLAMQRVISELEAAYPELKRGISAAEAGGRPTAVTPE